MAEHGETWREMIRQTRTYLEILREGGIEYAEGRFASPAPEVPRMRPSAGPMGQQAARPSSMTVGERAALKSALTDPYAHLAPPKGQPASSPPPASRPAPSPRAAPPVLREGAPLHAPAPVKSKSVTLKDRAEGIKTIAAAQDLERIRYLVSGCYMCGLSAGRTHTVPGDGNPRAGLMFVGEGPGYHEDMQGRPFVGRAGELLTKMIEAMGLRRDEVFITNIVKCRPPGNRDPLPDEILACEPYLKRQIELIRPKIICALGRIAIQGLLRDTTPISQLRGKWRSYQDIPLMPTFHPAYLLRSPEGKRFAWDDLKAIMAKMGLNPGGRTGP